MYMATLGESFGERPNIFASNFVISSQSLELLLKYSEFSNKDLEKYPAQLNLMLKA